ncbi:hypothetical protein DF213_20435 [Dickeya dianthicola]|uniref:Uncharacterized protein n=1 Tax=Dickeya dianthicola TaxID=204039 RepID=A0AAX1C1W7_9GAMM|nr:hypothetical protein DF213_20435 [Dickeya dianthicola]
MMDGGWIATETCSHFKITKCFHILMVFQSMELPVKTGLIFHAEIAPAPMAMYKQPQLAETKPARATSPLTTL